MLCETYLKEEFPCIYSRFLLRQVRQAPFFTVSKCSMKTYSKKSKYFKIISFFLLSRKNFLLKTRGAKSFAGRTASHFRSVVATCSREPIGNQFCKSPPSFLLQAWRRVLSPDVIMAAICKIGSRLVPSYR